MKEEKNEKMRKDKEKPIQNSRIKINEIGNRKSNQKKKEVGLVK